MTAIEPVEVVELLELTEGRPFDHIARIQEIWTGLEQPLAMEERIPGKLFIRIVCETQNLGSNWSQSSSRSRFLAFGVGNRSTRTLFDLSFELSRNIYICDDGNSLRNGLIGIFYLSPGVSAQEKNTCIATSGIYLTQYHGIFAVLLA